MSEDIESSKDKEIEFEFDTTDFFALKAFFSIQKFQHLRKSFNNTQVLGYKEKEIEF